MTSNPFCTRFIRPGAIAYLFPPGYNMASLVERLKAHRLRGEIIGPHGSGKSTLVVALVGELQRRGYRVLHATIGAGQRRLPRGWHASAGRADVLVIDGYEQLTTWQRVAVRLCTRRGRGLVVTAHRHVGLPRLIDTAPDEAIAWRVVETLLAAGGTNPAHTNAAHGKRVPENVVERSDVSAAFCRCGANVREMLLALYDLYALRAADDGQAMLQKNNAPSADAISPA